VERVLLLHGLWLRGFVLLPLRARLRAAGFDAHTFGYASAWSSPRAHLARLQRAIRELPGEGPVHLVGHSLGGLLAVECARAYPELPIGRIVCLGSPITGSSTAVGLIARGPLGRVLGRAIHLLRQGVLPLPEGFQIGVIAGTLKVGLGRWFGQLGESHDGTVALAETQAPELADHVQIRTSHTGLIYSSEVVRQVAVFLREGRFERIVRQQE
jgi:pimeloyl-ACP methyl ester carboxylesterase